MKTIVIAGGSGAVGIESARKLLAKGHRVILLGRDARKGAEIVASFSVAQDRAQFLAADLSTHDGVRAAAAGVNEVTECIDGLIHSAAVFVTKDIRTRDGLNLFFELSYLSRYHLTQLLLPKLLAAETPRVVMLIAGLNKVPKIDPALFPDFKDFSFLKAVMPVNGACMYYADYLMKQHPSIFAACVSPGFVRSSIFRDAPWFLRAYAAVLGPFTANTSEVAAQNVVKAVLDGEGRSAYNWPKAGDFEKKFAITVDHGVQMHIMAVSRSISGA